MIKPNYVEIRYDEQLQVSYRSPSIYGNAGSIKIVSSGGKAYFSATIDAQEKEYILDSSQWPSGMYYGIYTNQTGKHKIMPFMVYH